MCGGQIAVSFFSMFFLVFLSFYLIFISYLCNVIAMTGNGFYQLIYN